MFCLMFQAKTCITPALNSLNILLAYSEEVRLELIFSQRYFFWLTQWESSMSELSLWFIVIAQIPSARVSEIWTLMQMQEKPWLTAYWVWVNCWICVCASSPLQSFSLILLHLSQQSQSSWRRGSQKSPSYRTSSNRFVTIIIKLLGEFCGSENICIATFKVAVIPQRTKVW